MTIPRPHFLLLCDGSLSESRNTKVGTAKRGRWRFVLESLSRDQRLEVSDVERVNTCDRLALIAIVRGLEALEQPSDVTLVTTSRYVWRGLETGLAEWREKGYCWEHFGILQPIRNQDLWQRIDQALQFHTLHCRLMCPNEIDTCPETELADAETIDTVSMAIEPIAVSETTLSEPHCHPLPPESSAVKPSKNSDEFEVEMIPVAPNRWRRIDAPHDNHRKTATRGVGLHLPFAVGSREMNCPTARFGAIRRKVASWSVLKILRNSRLLRDIAFDIMEPLGIRNWKRSFS